MSLVDIFKSFLDWAAPILKRFWRWLMCAKAQATVPPKDQERGDNDNARDRVPEQGQEKFQEQADVPLDLLPNDENAPLVYKKDELLFLTDKHEEHSIAPPAEVQTSNVAEKLKANEALIEDALVVPESPYVLAVDQGYYRRALGSPSLEGEFKLLDQNYKLLRQTQVIDMPLAEIEKLKPTWDEHVKTKDALKAKKKPLFQDGDSMEDILGKMRFYIGFRAYKNGLVGKSMTKVTTRKDRIVGPCKDRIKKLTVPSKRLSVGTNEYTDYHVCSSTFVANGYIPRNLFDENLGAEYEEYKCVLAINATMAQPLALYSGNAESLYRTQRVDFHWAELASSYHQNYPPMVFSSLEQLIGAQEGGGVPQKYNEVLTVYNVLCIDGVETTYPIRCKYICSIAHRINEINDAKLAYKSDAELNTALYVLDRQGQKIYSISLEVIETLVHKREWRESDCDGTKSRRYEFTLADDAEKLIDAINDYIIDGRYQCHAATKLDGVSVAHGVGHGDTLRY